jgi:hypothetical protein
MTSHLPSSALRGDGGNRHRRAAALGGLLGVVFLRGLDLALLDRVWRRLRLLRECGLRGEQRGEDRGDGELHWGLSLLCARF